MDRVGDYKAIVVRILDEVADQFPEEEDMELERVYNKERGHFESVGDKKDGFTALCFTLMSKAAKSGYSTTAPKRESPIRLWTRAFRRITSFSRFTPSINVPIQASPPPETRN